MCGGADRQAGLLGLLQSAGSGQAWRGFELGGMRAGDRRKEGRQEREEVEARRLLIRVLEPDRESVASGDPLGRLLLPLSPLLIGRIWGWAKRKESGFGRECLRCPAVSVHVRMCQKSVAVHLDRRVDSVHVLSVCLAAHASQP